MTKVAEDMLIEFPDDGSWSRRVRRWNIAHGFALTWVFWLVVALGVWRLA